MAVTERMVRRRPCFGIFQEFTEGLEQIDLRMSQIPTLIASNVQVNFCRQ